MKPGKLPPDLLDSLVFKHLPRTRGDILVRAGLGQDSSIIDFGEFACVLSTDPITAASAESGWYAVHIACNDIAATGAEPVGVLLTVLAPTSSTEAEIEACVRQAARAAKELGIEILGGHTEVTPGIQTLIISAAAVGKASKTGFVTAAGARPGDDLVLTKAAGLEGTAIIAADHEDALVGKVPASVLQAAKQFRNRISVVKEGLAAARNGATAMHDVTEGGVLGAAFEMAGGAGIGIDLWEDAIPVMPETAAICEALGVDHLKLISSGAMCIAARDGEKMVSDLAAEGIEASVIGRFSGPGDPLILYPSRGSSAGAELAPPESDELWRIKAVLEGSRSRQGF